MIGHRLGSIQRRSLCPPSGSRGEMVPAFDEAALALGVDEQGGVVETEFGFHLICRMG